MSNSPDNRPGMGERYRHYKGALYNVHAVARNSEDAGQLMVIYATDSGPVWVRPLDNWLSPVEGQPGVKRFERIE